jgi:mRNA interferase HigB
VIDVRCASDFKACLRDFWSSRKQDSRIAERDLSAWYKFALRDEWSSFAEMKQSFGSADQVGNCVVFDVGGNRFRVIARINYGHGKVFVLRVMDHAEYDKGRWVNDCGCHRAPPRRIRASPKAKR